jgi:hypothetical protein
MWRHARSQSWPLLDEAVAVTHPLGATAEDAERWWRAYQLAENDQVGELREHASAGDEHAARQLASRLTDRVRIEEAIEVIRPLAAAGDEVAGLWLARWLADGDHLDELRQWAGSGSYPALHELAGWLVRHEHSNSFPVSESCCWSGWPGSMA